MSLGLCTVSGSISGTSYCLGLCTVSAGTISCTIYCPFYFLLSVLVLCIVSGTFFFFGGYFLLFWCLLWHFLLSLWHFLLSLVALSIVSVALSTVSGGSFCCLCGTFYLSLIHI